MIASIEPTAPPQLPPISGRGKSIGTTGQGISPDVQSGHARLPNPTRCCPPWSARYQRRELNENLSPFRRYLVRDHLGDFVAIKPRRRHGWYFSYPSDGKEPFSGLWYQPLYVDEKDGILKCTDRLPEEKARLRARRNPSPRPLDRVALAADRELRRIDGFWYELRLAPMPDPVYRAIVEHRDVRLKPFDRRSPVVRSRLPCAT